VKQCQVCQQAKHENTHPAGLLQPLPVPRGAWQDITMDFIEGLPKSETYDTILVVVDRFSKYAHFISLRHPFTAQVVARAVFDNVVKLHGLPKSIVSDRDKVFTGHFWTELLKLMDITLNLSTAYHPQTDGQSERVNQCLEMFLRCSVYNDPKKWHKWLSQAELRYNTTYHSSLKCTPFQALYGYEPNLIGTPLVQESATPEVKEWAAEREAQNDMLRSNLLAAQNKIKHQADKNRVDREFQVGEHVLLKLQPYAQKTVVNRTFPKLSLKYYGPFVVQERIGKAAYRLELPAEAKVHPVFHVSQLKPFTPNYTPVYNTLPKVLDLEKENVEPEQIMERRLVRKGNQAITQILVKWTNLPPHATTWEDANVLRTRFPKALAWGQAISAGGEAVTTVPEVTPEQKDGDE
jgi:hypothetical protein